MDLRAARVVKAEPVDKADKLLRLRLDLGGLGQRTVLAGIRKSFPDPSALIGRTVVCVANLAPRKMRGEISEGMVLATGDDEAALTIVGAEGAPPGSRIR